MVGIQRRGIFVKERIVRLFAGINKVFMCIAAVFLLLITLITTMNVVVRTFGFGSVVWAEELDIIIIAAVLQVRH